MNSFDYMVQNPTPDTALVETILGTEDQAEDPGQSSSNMPGNVSNVDDLGTHVVFNKFTDKHVKCTISSTGGSIKLGRQWRQIFVLHENRDVPCFTHESKGKQYWTAYLNQMNTT
jgi:hypothetical protein